MQHIAEEFDQCIKCGLCLATCPVCKELLLEKYSPRGKIQLARYYSGGTLALSDHYRDIFARCLLCGACSATCPSGVDLQKVFLRMREELAAQRGLHPSVERVVQALAANRNISDEDNSERAEWAESCEGVVPADGSRSAAVVYFVGCVASFFPMAGSIPRNLVRIMQAGHLDFTVLAGDEWCCGYPLLGAGVPDRMKELKEHNLQKVASVGAKRVVFSCPSCLRTWKEEYGTDLELLHSTQLIDAMIKDGAITPGRVEGRVTYHDPCDLGRHGGIYDAPRRILSSIPGLTLVELAGARELSVCCGGGGNLEMADPALSGDVAERKIQQIRNTHASTVVTSCQQCMRTIKGRVRKRKADLDVVDITEMVVRSISGSEQES